MNKIYYLFLFLILIPILIISSEATIFEGNNDKNYIYFDIENKKINGILKINDKIIAFDEKIKFYKNKNFITINNNFLIHGKYFAQNNYDLTIIDKENREKFSIKTTKIQTDDSFQIFEKENISPLEKFEKSKIKTGPESIKKLQQIQQELSEKEKLKEIEEKIIVPRSEYVLDPKQKIGILSQIMNKVATFSFFEFDLRIVDINKNNLNDYYNDGGYIDNAEILAIIKDSNGKILKKFNGITSNQGHYAPSEGTYMPGNLPFNKPFTLEVTATKFFDDSNTFTTNSIQKEFFVYFSDDPPLDFNAPVGTITIQKPVNKLPLKLSLTCTDYNSKNIETKGHCANMAFSETGNFINSEILPFVENVIHFYNLANGNHTIYVQFTDDSPQKNKSLDEISDFVIVNVTKTN